MPRARSLFVTAGLILATVLPAGADPGKITKYVFPDGTVVYSDKPVPGATAVGEVVVPPTPTLPPRQDAGCRTADTRRRKD